MSQISHRNSFTIKLLKVLRTLYTVHSVQYCSDLAVRAPFRVTAPLALDHKKKRRSLSLFNIIILQDVLVERRDSQNSLKG